MTLIFFISCLLFLIVSAKLLLFIGIYQKVSSLNDHIFVFLHSYEDFYECTDARLGSIHPGTRVHLQCRPV